MFTNGSCFFLQELSGLWVNWECKGPDQDRKVGMNALDVQGSTNAPNPFYQFIQNTNNREHKTLLIPHIPFQLHCIDKFKARTTYTLCPFPHLAFSFDFVQPDFTPCHSSGTALAEGPVTLCQQYFHLILLLLSEAFGSIDRFLLVETRFWLLGHHVLLVPPCLLIGPLPLLALPPLSALSLLLCLVSLFLYVYTLSLGYLI